MAIWEFAPGSPWNAIFSFLVMLSVVSLYRRLLAPLIGTKRQYLAGGFEVGLGIDAARNGVHDGHVDPHARFQRPKLFELFLALQRGWRQRYKALQCRAAIGIEPDVVVARPVAGRCRGTRKIKRAQSPRADRRADRL